MDLLEDKINLIYEYLYNNTSQNSNLRESRFLLDKIIYNEIKLDDIKFSLDIGNTYYDTNKDNILSGKFKLISYDEDTDMILFKRYSNQFPVNVKINFYKRDENINSLDNNINKDSLFSYLLSQLVLSHKTKHILLPIMNIDMNISDLDNMIKNESFYKKVKDDYDVCCLQVREHFFKTNNLDDYLKNNKCSLKPLLFQVIHTLATIQNDYNGFAHNNLKLKNILIYLKRASDSYVEYNGFKNDVFYLNSSEFDIKITNFEDATITKNPQPSQDLYIFLNDLLTNIKLSIADDCDSQTKKFIDYVLSDKMLQYRNLLYNEYFNDYKNKPSKNVDKGSTGSIISHEYLTGKNIETYMESDNFSILGNQDKLISKSNIMIKQHRSIKSQLDSDKLNRNQTEDDFSHKRTINKSNVRLISSEIEQNGGDNKPTMTPYKAEKNNPFVSNDQRDTNKKYSAENPPKEPNVILEQKIYDTSKQQPSKPQFPPTFIPLYDQQGDVMNHMLPYSKVMNQPPVQKIYNVSLSNPIGNYTSLNRIYEDTLPSNPFTYTAISLFERRQLIDFLRNSILENADGEEMTVTGGKNSLLSYIKVMDINPYIVKKNPYENLPRNFLLYRAGYPVRFDEKNKLINLGKNAMGLNIRIYMMSLGDLRCKTIEKHLNADNFDLWREIKYYDWVRDSIIKKKISPNFICPILYKIDSESKIDWGKVDMIKHNSYTNDTLKQLKDNQNKVNNLHKIEKSSGLFNRLLPADYRRQVQRAVREEMGHKNPKEPSKCERPTPMEVVLEQDRLNRVKKVTNAKELREFANNAKAEAIVAHNADRPDKDEKGRIAFEAEARAKAAESSSSSNVIVTHEKEDITINSGKVLILVTEAPTTNILQWSSVLYESFGSQQKMISTGYHTADVWKAILFQLVYAFAVLQEKQIHMEKISLENNIYIKDIFSDPNAIGSWIYKVNSVDYYVPNYGYVLVFDSKYADVETDQSLVKMEPGVNESNRQRFKICGKIYEKNSIPMSNIETFIHTQFKELIDPDNFTHKLKVPGGSIPDDSIIDLLTKMKNYSDPNIKIRDYIPKFFGEFVHNRVGTLLTQTEKANINMFSKPNFVKGNLMVYQRRNQEYEWVVYVGDVNDPNSVIKKRNIIQYKDSKYMIVEVFSNALFSYPENEMILPETKKNMKYDETHIYETYNLDN